MKAQETHLFVMVSSYTEKKRKSCWIIDPRETDLCFLELSTGLVGQFRQALTKTVRYCVPHQVSSGKRRRYAGAKSRVQHDRGTSQLMHCLSTLHNGSLCTLAFPKYFYKIIKLEERKELIFVDRSEQIIVF